MATYYISVHDLLQRLSPEDVHTNATDAAAHLFSLTRFESASSASTVPSLESSSSTVSTLSDTDSVGDFESPSSDVCECAFEAVCDPTSDLETDFTASFKPVLHNKSKVAPIHCAS